MIADYAKSVMSVRIKMSKQFITKAHYPKSPEDINIYTIHPPKSDLILLYEVVDKQGRGLWGGEDNLEAIKWLRLNLRDEARLLVSAWDSDEEDAHLVGQSIDITDIILEAFKEGLRV
jgi:hypothetical protein